MLLMRTVWVSETANKYANTLGPILNNIQKSVICCSDTLPEACFNT